MSLGEEYDRQWFERLHPAFIKAAKENRLICNNEGEHYNATPIWMVNMLLKRNGYALLSCADQTGTLEQIPMYACVPRVSDDSRRCSGAAHPLRGNWRNCWGRSIEDIDAVFASLDEAAAEDLGRPANWMDELNKPIIDAARAKFGKALGKGDAAEGADDALSAIRNGDGDYDNAFWSPSPASTSEFGTFMDDDQASAEGGKDPAEEEEDRLDFWKKGRPQDEEVEARKASANVLRAGAVRCRRLYTVSLCGGRLHEQVSCYAAVGRPYAAFHCLRGVSHVIDSFSGTSASLD